MENWINKLASAIQNDIVSGLRGYHSTMSLPISQIEDEIILQRMMVIKEFQLKGILPINDLMLSINCIPVDCKNIEKCSCYGCGTPTLHFEIPQIITDYGASAISFVGTIDRKTQFPVYTSNLKLNVYSKYKRRNRNKPFVYIDITPNENDMLDCFIYNMPLIKVVSVSAVFKDPRQLCNYQDCAMPSNDNFSWINMEIKNRIVEQKIRFYRQLAAPIIPNTQTVEAG